MRIEGIIAGDESETYRKIAADARLDDQLTRALEREEELLFPKAAATEGEQQASSSAGPANFDISTLQGTPLKADDMDTEAEIDKMFDDEASVSSPL